MDVMPTPELNQLFRTAQREVFRLETLDTYDAPGERAEFDAFLSGQPVLQATPGNDPWLANVQARTTAGVRWRRVHIVRRPISDYLRFEFSGYKDNILAGEEVRIADISKNRDLLNFKQDFWLFDNTTAILMKYDQSGLLIDTERTNDISEHVGIMNYVLSQSIPLNEYTEEYSIG